ncbi:methyl-accepting chemotaxis sensory transducer [Desulfitobacterium hafniense DCB-2]|uniref:Methyl-accepting chemotaxis protein signaling domain protein n=2 Tax=Desulfitobacterium hafniense TaxID=49338 RepID=A0A098B5S5_DESHA|nr:methyl-accepting chemotaxis protein [Desulfitobacterium hafniense]ACL19947.1 methyl-accepting chemotaxis sensory transducer [Desulfitobacterium hafniense DCB-2]CDX03697.1 Methyl-accepting chemotaxis protein signaling domain protein [Desulfitobacterium hafniense]
MDYCEKSDEEILENYEEVLIHLKDLLNEDMMATITNKTHSYRYFPGNKMAIKGKDPHAKTELLPDNHLLQAMKARKRKVTIVPKHEMGFPFLSIAYPIEGANGEIIGCVGIGKSLEREHKIEEISHGLAATLQQVDAGLQEVAAGSQGLSLKINTAVKLANESAIKIKEIDTVISAISDISSYSNLLGLNASIEAARAGEHGRGFAVVAEEMRKLAMQSNVSAKTVTQILTQMKDSIEEIIAEINAIGSIAENQAAATEEITAAVTDVGTNAQNLAALSTIRV